MFYLYQCWLWLFIVCTLLGAPVTIFNAWREYRDWPNRHSYGAFVGTCLAPVIYIPSIYFCWLGVNSLSR